MTILGRSLRKPRLREKDGYCLLSYFDGYNYSYPTTASNGNFVNTGTLGDLSELRLGTTSTYLRVPMTSKFGHSTPLLNPGFYGCGLSTDSTAYGLSSSVTMEGWFYISSISSKTYLLTRSYNTAWSGAYASYCVILSSSGQVGEMHATSTSTYSISYTSNILPLNQWGHFGLTWVSGGDFIIYFNGVAVITISSITMYTDSSGFWCFGGGGKLFSSSEGVIGMMAGIRVHNTVRSSDWFRETYNLGRGIL